MSHTLLDPVELRQRGFDALADALGWVNAVRFLQQYEISRLNYTVERDEVLPGWNQQEFIRGLERACDGKTLDPPGQRGP